MRITERELRNIIREVTESVLSESELDGRSFYQTSIGHYRHTGGVGNWVPGVTSIAGPRGRQRGGRARISPEEQQKYWDKKEQNFKDIVSKNAEKIKAARKELAELEEEIGKETDKKIKSDLQGRHRRLSDIVHNAKMSIFRLGQAPDDINKVGSAKTDIYKLEMAYNDLEKLLPVLAAQEKGINQKSEYLNRAKKRVPEAQKEIEEIEKKLGILEDQVETVVDQVQDLSSDVSKSVSEGVSRWQRLAGILKG